MVANGSGLYAPARKLSLLLALSVGTSVAAQAQPRPVAPAAVAAPDLQTVNKLVWSTLAAIDHGNLTGNYSVLRDLGAPGFQANNNAATLAGVFAQVRDQRIDLSNTLLLAPSYEFAPGIVNGLLRARGAFGLRPTAVRFDLLYANIAGRWQLFGVAVAPVPMPVTQPAPIRR
jgi:hypothetical protein